MNKSPTNILPFLRLRNLAKVRYCWQAEATQGFHLEVKGRLGKV